MPDSNRLLTTVDNPWNPFTNWDEWYSWDVANGYNTCSFVARLANINPNMSEQEENEAIESAYVAIINMSPENLYKIISNN